MFAQQSKVTSKTVIVRPKPVFLKDVEKNYGWSRAVEKLGMDIELSKKFQIKWMKENFPQDTFSSIKVPYLLFGVKSFHASREDIMCVVEDPTGDLFKNQLLSSVII